MQITTRGFTLIELMIAVAVLAIVVAIAVPAYNGYVRESRLGSMRMNLDSLRIAVEAFRLDSPTQTYKGTTAAPYVDTQIASVYGWSPETGGGTYDYKVYAATSTIYGIQAALGSIAWVRCDKNNATGTYTCCDNTASGCTKQ